MKSFFLRMENWLLIVPFILLLIEKFFFAYQSVDLHIHDTYFVLPLYHIGFVLFLSLLIPYLCHCLLRTTKKRNGKVNAIHVSVTIFLLLYFSYSFISGDQAPRKYYDFS